MLVAALRTRHIVARIRANRQQGRRTNLFSGSHNTNQSENTPRKDINARRRKRRALLRRKSGARNNRIPWRHDAGRTTHSRQKYTATRSRTKETARRKKGLNPQTTLYVTTRNRLASNHARRFIRIKYLYIHISFRFWTVCRRYI